MHRYTTINSSQLYTVCIGGGNIGAHGLYTPLRMRTVYLYTLFFSIPFIILAFLLSPSLAVVVVAQIRGHIAGPPPPSPLRYVPLFLSREEFSNLFPRRLASNCAYPRCKAFSAVDPFFCIFSYTVKISPQWESNSRTNALVVFEGNH